MVHNLVTYLPTYTRYLFFAPRLSFPILFPIAKHMLSGSNCLQIFRTVFSWRHSLSFASNCIHKFFSLGTGDSKNAVRGER